jgi:hypothetical protein
LILTLNFTNPEVVHAKYLIYREGINRERSRGQARRKTSGEARLAFLPNLATTGTLDSVRVRVPHYQPGPATGAATARYRFEIALNIRQVHTEAVRSDGLEGAMQLVPDELSLMWQRLQFEITERNSISSLTRAGSTRSGSTGRHHAMRMNQTRMVGDPRDCVRI